MRMFGSPAVGTALTIASLVLVGCVDVTTEPAGRMDAEDVESLALFLAEGDAFASWVSTETTHQRSGSGTFSRTVECPVGGTRSFSGSSSQSFDASERVVTATWSNTQVHEGCAFPRRHGQRRVVTVLDGSVTVTGEASYRLPAGRGEGRTVLAYRRTRAGSITTTVAGRTSTCVIDVVELYDPATNAFMVSGEVCGRVVDIAGTAGRIQDP
jgi:hypothetical protein